MSFKSTKRDQWFISDTHFGHENLLKFEPDTNGRFNGDIHDRDAHLVERINSVVKPGDRLYILGDVVLNKKHLEILEMVNGDKVLVKGNHDVFKLKDYTPYFDDIRSMLVFNVKNYCPVYGDKLPPIKFICTHIPIHASELGRFGYNVHGHLHSNKITGVFAEKYINVCTECLDDFTPVHIDEIINTIKMRGILR